MDRETVNNHRSFQQTSITHFFTDYFVFIFIIIPILNNKKEKPFVQKMCDKAVQMWFNCVILK